MTTLNVTLTTTLKHTLGHAGVSAYAVYFNEGSAHFTTLVDDGVVQNSGSFGIELPDPYISGKVYFLIQSQATQTDDLTTLITEESDISWNNAEAWDFRYDSFEVNLSGSEYDVGNLTSVVGWGLPMEVSVTYSDSTTATVGYKQSGSSIATALGNVGHSPTAFNFDDGPLNGTFRAAVSPSQAVGNTPTIAAYASSDWTAYVNSLKVSDPGIEIAGFFNGAPDADGVWHNGAFFSYSLEWDTTNNVFWLTPADNSEARGNIQITPTDLENSIYSTLGDVGIFTNQTDAEPYQIFQHADLGGDYTMNTGENNQWGKVLELFLTGFTAGFYGTEGQSPNADVTAPINLNQNWNWDPIYAFGQNLQGAAALFQDPYSEYFFSNSNSYGSGYSDGLMSQYAVGGPLIPVANPAGGNVATINLTIFDDSETPTGYVTPTNYNYIAPGSGYQTSFEPTSVNSVKLNFAYADMVLADDTPLSLDIYTGESGGDPTFQNVAFTVPAGESLWQAWQLSESGGDYSLTLQDNTPQGTGELLITNFATATSGTSWYRLHIGSGDDEKIFNLYIDTTGGAFLNPAYGAQAGSIAIDGLATIAPEASTAATIETFTINFIDGGNLSLDPDLLVRVPSADGNPGAPNAPVAGTIANSVFDALPNQTNQIANKIITNQAEIAFGWTGLNDATGASSWYSGYTNKVGGANYAQINFVNSDPKRPAPLAMLAQADIDGQWQTAASKPLSNGKYTVTMSEYAWSDTSQETQLGETSSALILRVVLKKMQVAEGDDALALTGPETSGGNWIKLKTAKSFADPGKTLLLYAVDEDGNLVGRNGETGNDVTLDDATLGTVGAIHDDSGNLLMRGGQSVFLHADHQLRFAVLSGDGRIDDDPRVRIEESRDGSMRVKVGGFVIDAETDNSLSDTALLADAQRTTNEALLYLQHGETLNLDILGDGDRRSTLGFVRIDIDPLTGEWSVNGVDYGHTKAFKAAVRDSLDDGFLFRRGGEFDVEREWTVDGETGYYAPVLLTKSGATLMIGDANPGGHEYVRMFGQNIFGFEETTSHRSDFDYNDMVVRITPAGGDLVV